MRPSHFQLWLDEGNPELLGGDWDHIVSEVRAKTAILDQGGQHPQMLIHSMSMGSGSISAWVNLVEENIEFSQSGFVCITCRHEVGSGGH